MHEIQADRIYTIEEVAVIFDASVRTIYRRLLNKELVGKKVGRTWLFTGRSLIDYMDGENAEIESKLLEEELVKWDPRFKGSATAFEDISNKAPNRKSILFQIEQLVRSLRESSLTLEDVQDLNK